MRQLPSCILTAALVLSCGPAAAPASLVFNIEPSEQGALVRVLVEGGPTGTIWVGFGVGPGVPPSRVERVSEFRALGPSGEELPVEPYGYAAFRVERGGSGPWQLSYRLDLRPEAGNGNFYRASVRGDDYLVLVGSDAWPRLYTGPTPLSFQPDNRPPGRADLARATLDVPADSSWEVVAVAEDVTRRSFRFADHPATTVILAGAFRPPRDLGGTELRVHRSRDVLDPTTDGLIGDLAHELRDRLGPPSDRSALAVMLPLPAVLVPTAGLRTAGMVRNRTAVLYGGLAPNANRASPRIREAMAVFIGHELFHLYVPSALPVSRDLSWMSEGWAMHMGRLVAREIGAVSADSARAQLRRTYRRYLDMGGYRAGSLPDASMGSESQRDLLYLRGELVFRLLELEWRKTNPDTDFEEHLWRQLEAIGDGMPLTAAQVSAVLETMVGPHVVRRYVEGTAPLTQGALGLSP